MCEGPGCALQAFSNRHSYQVLWWGMDETLAELFACHPSCGFFEGNPMDAFWALIMVEEYGLDETPESIGFYGGRYLIVFHPDEWWRAVRAKAVEANPCPVLIPGIDYVHREIENNMLLVEHHLGESKMSDGLGIVSGWRISCAPRPVGIYSKLGRLVRATCVKMWSRCMAARGVMFVAALCCIEL